MYDSSTLQRAALVSTLVVAALSAHAKAGTPTQIAGQVSREAQGGQAAESCHFDADGNTWWTGFNDAALNLLHAVASARSGAPGHKPTAADARAVGCAQAELAAAYVQLRVLALRRAIAQSMLDTTARQNTLLKQQASPADSAQQVLATRMERARAQLREIEIQHLHFVQVLGQRTGLREEQLMTALAPALNENSVPRFHMVIPVRVPGALLRQRSDMAELERKLMLDARRSPSAERRLASHTRSLGGWIAADGTDDVSTDPAAEVADAKADPARKLRGEVARDLRALIDRGNAAAMLGQLVSSRRIEFESTRQRQQMGQAGELEATERYYAMLFDSDRVAAVSGEMALAWIQLQRRTGGALQVDTRGEARADPGAR